jgi:hypothetical protein
MLHKYVNITIKNNNPTCSFVLVCLSLTTGKNTDSDLSVQEGAERTFGKKSTKIARGYRKLHNEDNNLYSSPGTITTTKSRKTEVYNT